MMKILLTAVIALLFQLVLPWWSVAVAAFLIGAGFNQTGFKSFLNGFLGIFGLWTLLALGISIFNGMILAERLAVLFALPHGLLTILVTGLIGGLVGGFVALTGNRLREILIKKNDEMVEAPASFKEMSEVETIP